MKISYLLSFILQMVYMTHSNDVPTNQGLNNQNKKQCMENNQQNMAAINVDDTEINNQQGESLLMKILKRVRRAPKQSKKKMKQIRKDLIKRGLPPRSTPTPKYLYRFHEDHLIACPYPYVIWQRALKVNSIMARTQTMPFGSTLNKTVITFFTAGYKKYKKNFAPGANRPRNLKQKGRGFGPNQRFAKLDE